MTSQKRLLNPIQRKLPNFEITQLLPHNAQVSISYLICLKNENDFPLISHSKKKTKILHESDTNIFLILSFENFSFFPIICLKKYNKKWKNYTYFSHREIYNFSLFFSVSRMIKTEKNRWQICEFILKKLRSEYFLVPPIYCWNRNGNIKSNEFFKKNKSISLEFDCCVANKCLKNIRTQQRNWIHTNIF